MIGKMSHSKQTSQEEVMKFRKEVDGLTAVFIEH
jgi:hypothetical protein